MVASASEEEVYVNDQKYLINAEEKTATLDKCSDASGDYVIPESVEYEGVTYTVTAISGLAFFNSEITSVVIPNTVTLIYGSAFNDCINLRTVTIGKGHKEVYEDCFTLCVTLTDVYCEADGVPFTAISAFNACDLSKVKLHVPERLIDEYKTTEPWKQFGTILSLTGEETGIKSIDRDGSSEMLRFTLDGKRLNAPQKGINIIKTPNGQTRKVLVK